MKSSQHLGLGGSRGHGLPGSLQRLASRADGLARRSFDLPATELADINRWLIPKSRLTCLFILIFVYSLALAGVELPVLFITILCGVALAMSRPFSAWLASGQALGLLIYTQFVFDILVLTIGLASLPRLTVLLHLQLLMVIIPCALLSRQCGTIMAGLAIAAHLYLVWLRGSASAVEVLAPIYFFLIIAHQCFFYGARLATKTHQAEEESTVASALLRVADELVAERTSTALVQRLATLAKEITGGSWTAVVLHDPERRAFVIRALISRTGMIDDEVLSVGPPPGIALDPRVAGGTDDDGCIAVDSPESSLLPPELHERWLAGSYLASVLRRAGEPVGILFVGFDDASRLRSVLTRRLVVGMARQALLALENARLVEYLQSANTLKSEFISTISHELRSPLHAIIGYTEILRDEQSPDSLGAARRDDMLARVRVHALHLHEMIEATLAVNRLESGRLPVRLAVLSPRALFAEIEAEIPDFRRKPEVALEWRVAPDLPAVESDPGKLKMIVRNLVENALKFTDAGSVLVAVQLEPDLGNMHDGRCALLRIAVSDTGIGIAPEQRAAVFEMYRQGDGSLTRRHAGLGLGLYIVKRLVEALQGRILLESTPGSGTTVEVVIPVGLIAFMNRQSCINEDELPLRD